MILLTTVVQAGVGDVLSSWLTPQDDKAGLLEGIIYFAIFASICFFSFSKMSTEESAKPALIMLSLSVALAFTIALVLANITLKKALPFAGIILALALFLGIFAGTNAVFRGKKESSSMGAKVFSFFLALVLTIVVVMLALSTFCKDCDFDFGSDASSRSKDNSSSSSSSGASAIEFEQYQNLLKTYGDELSALKKQSNDESKLAKLEELKDDLRSLRQDVQLNGVEK